MEVLELAKKLIEFPSTEDNKVALHNCFEFCINYFKNNNKIFTNIKEVEGLETVLISNVDSIDLDVLEIGHIDVVPVSNNKMYSPMIKDGIMYGRGVSDMKTQVAGAMKLLEFVVENNIKIKFGVLIVTDEETVGKCSDFWVNKIGLKSKIILDGDGEHGINKIIDRKKACVFVDLISKGKLAHGSKPWLGIDANENLIQSIVNLRKVFPYICKNSKPESEWFTTMHVGIIKGGRATNSIADYAEASLDFRYVEDYNDEKLMKIIEQNLVGDTKAIQKEKGILMLNDINNKYLQFYKNIIEKEIGGNVEFEIGLGTSDSRFFVNKDTAIIVAEPLGGGAHSDDEWLNVEEFYKYFKIRKKFLSSVETIL